MQNIFLNPDWDGIAWRTIESCAVLSMMNYAMSFFDQRYLYLFFLTWVPLVFIIGQVLTDHTGTRGGLG
jgi:hypothetical protein